MRPSLECRAMMGRGNDICVAQYLPRGVKNEYFGLMSLLGYNLTRCQVEDVQAMELILITSLMTILDKADDNGWKKETSSGHLFLEPNEIPSIHHPDDDNHHTLKKKQKEQLQKEKSERNNEQRLQWMLEKDVRRSQKQLLKQGYASHQQSPLGSPKMSPVPSPSTSTHDLQQQLEHLSHMLSTMKHTNDATATLPSSFVQQQTSQLQSIWYTKEDDDSIPSRHHNSLYRSQSQSRRLPADRVLQQHTNQHVLHRISVPHRHDHLQR
ncbi:uncharacterized protein BX664DRAFT_199714 [Halteromyces radiatus]|uniref:uncharacterized protein n=1 Tax=Halteromyces radiatus TaxID=101107 RepID=UPI0022205DCC|nr:uncharacterized protein BX664DRAFT_199714 [Halteromyces radiatus]KAI8081734.1 hypothetical protein BX664DRAFT_199714 [Halteromyces radiatus]